MSIIQVSEKEIRNYQILDEHLGMSLEHNESDLFYKDDIIYKIFNKMFRVHREQYMWILDNNKFEHCINVESLLYQGDKLIGISTSFYENLKSLKQLITEKKIDLYEAKCVYEILNILQKKLLIYELCYIDSNLSNINLCNGDVLIGDLDGVYYKPDKNIIEASYINFCKTFISLIVKDDLFKYENYEQKEILKYLFNDISLESLKTNLTEMTQIKADDLCEKYYKKR